MNALEKFLQDEYWRLDIPLYAEHMSLERNPYVRYRWVEHMAATVQEHISYKKDARLIINAPPRHGKSFFTSYWLPVWYLDTWPNKKVMMTCYGDSLAAEWGQMCRDEFVMNPETLTTLRGDSKAVGNWKTLEGGGMRTAGIGGPITGKGGDLIIIDDPHKNWEDAMSSASRNRVIEWFKNTLYNRAEPNAAIVVVQTRWHENDLTGYLINEHPDDWTVIRYPAIAEENDVLGRGVGEVLCPERYSRERLKVFEEMGAYMFAGLFQQRPAPLVGGMISKHWFRRWTELPEFDEVLQSWDCTFHDHGSSYVVGQVWGKKDANFFLIDQVREKMDFPTTVKKVLTMTKRYPEAVVKLVEDKANGPAVIDSLKDSIPGIISTSPGSANKVSRLAAVSGMIESGNVYIPEDKYADWVSKFVIESITFPNAEHDDQVDAMTQALKRFQGSMGFETNLVMSVLGGQRTSPWKGLGDR